MLTMTVRMYKDPAVNLVMGPRHWQEASTIE